MMAQDHETVGIGLSLRLMDNGRRGGNEKQPSVIVGLKTSEAYINFERDLGIDMYRKVTPESGESTLRSSEYTP
jgi:hypothetical protein